MAELKILYPISPEWIKAQFCSLLGLQEVRAKTGIRRYLLLAQFKSNWKLHKLNFVRGKWRKKEVITIENPDTYFSVSGNYLYRPEEHRQKFIDLIWEEHTRIYTTDLEKNETKSHFYKPEKWIYKAEISVNNWGGVEEWRKPEIITKDLGKLDMTKTYVAYYDVIKGEITAEINGKKYIFKPTKRVNRLIELEDSGFGDKMQYKIITP